MSSVMYVDPHCPHCQTAREHVAARGERDATQDAAWKAELVMRNSGAVPTIVRGDRADVQVGFPPRRG